ncbi:MAG TPA: FAD-binding oxidoreductase [Clostridia bacterium]|nr:FAD-binding oxidoreductase [Clostridia bacterium]
MRDPLGAALRAIVGAEHVITDRAMRATYETDWTGRFRGTAELVVRPGSTAEVAAVVRACARAGVTIVPQGGNTGLVAGAVPHGSVVLSTRRLRSIEDVEPATGRVTVGAGATLAQVQDHAARSGLRTGVDLAARGSATIGGMIATDAGGIHAIRYGTTRDALVGVEAVLADGSVVGSLDGLGRDPAAALLAGSEGTLGIVTRARLRLIPAWPERATVLLAFSGLAAAVAAVPVLRARLPDLEAFEAFDRACLDLAAARPGAADPFSGRAPGAVFVLVEVAANRPVVDELLGAVADLEGVVDAVVAADGPDRRRLWVLREGIADAIATIGLPHKLDVGLPLDRLEAFVAALRPAVAAVDPAARTFVFGHLGLGNLHVNLVGPAADDERVDDAVLRLVLEHGGDISAEHGIGRAKARWMRVAHTAAELAFRARLKRALDPDGLLNPGVLAP